MRVALIHDWLVTYSGAERVTEQMLKCYPGADVFSLVDFLPDQDRHFLGSSITHVSWLQKAPFARKSFRNYLALMPYLIENFDLTSYDLVLSSSFAFAKGVIVGADQPHVSYVHTPIRYCSALKHQYLEQANLTSGLKSMYVKRVLHKLRQWDATSTNGVDLMVGNSNYIAKRINKTYRRPAEVIYPPVAIDDYPLQTKKQDFYLCVSRLVHYKRIDIVVEAFNRMPDRKLIVIGAGDEFERIKSTAAANVSMLGFQSHETLVAKMGQARAFIMPAEEDFGIVVAEAQASGTPVLAYARGGAPEILQTNPQKSLTGLLFDQQTPEAVIDIVERFERVSKDIDPAHCRDNSLRFAPSEFRRQFKKSVNGVLENI